ncbi:hypothetical protein ACTHAM_002698 [Cellulomonas soli]|uniref:hypothetical protein n=1 Tax=Cellulomonas soli TaxID=931535 RepID=UPI003F8494BE
MATTTASTTEYDRFGPWIDEVRTPEDVPRLYRDHPIDLVGARLVLKVPRNITRRDATPDMDLYDHLLVLHATSLTVLSRRTAGGAARAAAPGDYDAREIPCGDITAIHDVVNLLDGSLTVRTRDGEALTVRYNGSARESVRGLVDALRSSGEVPSAAGQALMAAGRVHGQAAAALDLGRDDLSLAGDVREVVRQAPTLKPWVGHGRRRVARRRRDTAAVLDMLSPTTLHGAVLAADTLAFEVFGRHEWLLRGKKPVHSSSRLVVPFAALDAIEPTPHPTFEGVVVVGLVSGASTVELAVPDDSAAHQVLVEAAARLARTEPVVQDGSGVAL